MARSFHPPADSFLLDYGSGLVTVEMDDFDTYGDAYGIFDGDRVTVTGDVDNDLFQTARIEAGSVYVEGIQQYFFANDADEEAVMATAVVMPVVLGQTIIRGTVTDVTESTASFTVDTGIVNIKVDTADMLYNPLDNFGFQQIDTGDRVSVTGNMDVEFFQGRVLDAEIITVLDSAD